MMTTASEILVTSTWFLITLATRKVQFWTLWIDIILLKTRSLDVLWLLFSYSRIGPAPSCTSWVSWWEWSPSEGCSGKSGKNMLSQTAWALLKFHWLKAALYSFFGVQGIGMNCTSARAFKNFISFLMTSLISFVFFFCCSEKIMKFYTNMKVIHIKKRKLRIPPKFMNRFSCSFLS